MKEIIDKDPESPLAKRFSLEVRGKLGLQAKFKTGPYKGQWLELAHGVSKKEIKNIAKINPELARDLSNLYPVGHRFHRRFMHVEQFASKWGSKLSTLAKSGISKYSETLGKVGALAKVLSYASDVREKGLFEGTIYYGLNTVVTRFTGGVTDTATKRDEDRLSDYLLYKISIGEIPNAIEEQERACLPEEIREHSLAPASMEYWLRR